MLYSIFFIAVMFFVVISNIGKFLKTGKLNKDQIVMLVMALPFVIVFLYIFLTFK